MATDKGQSIYVVKIHLISRLTFSANNILMGECVYSTSKKSNGTVHINYCLKSKVSITLHCQLQYIQPITQQYKPRAVQKASP